MIFPGPLFIVRMNVWNPNTPGAETLYAANRPFTAKTTALESPSTLTHYNVPAILIGAPKVRYELNDVGIMEMSGEIVLDNANGDLDYLYTYTFEGRFASMEGQLKEEYDSTLKTFLSPNNRVQVYEPYIMGKPEFAAGQVRIPVRAQSTLYLNQPLQKYTFAGTGALEGDSTMAGVPKPILLGKVFNVKPVLVDAAKNIYMLMGPRYGMSFPTFSGSIVTAVRDGGAPVTAGAKYADVTALNTTAPAAGQFRWLELEDSGNTGLFIRLGTAATYDITCDAECNPYQGGLGMPPLTLFSVPDMAMMFIWLVAGDGFVSGISIGDLDVYSQDPYTGYVLAAPNALTANDSFGFYNAAPDLTLADALGQLLTETCHVLHWDERNRGVASFNYPVRQPYNANDPVNTPLYLMGAEIHTMERITPTSKAIIHQATFRTSVRHTRNYFPQTVFAGSVSPANRELYQREAQALVTTDATVQTRYPNAPELKLGGGVTGTNLVANLESYGSTRFRGTRDVFEVTARLRPHDTTWRVMGGTSFGMPLGTSIRIKEYNRFGCSVQRDFMILGKEIDWAGGLISFLLWG